MPPYAGEVLEGHGIVTPNGIFHTYVVCPATGDNWDCHGLPRVPVPPPLCIGRGSIALAKCIEGGDEAGIKLYYRKAGVCHQIANRILFPANTSVPINHWQIRFSYTVYGRFGLNLSTMPSQNHWPERLHRCQAGGSIGAAESSSSEGIKSGVLSSMNDPALVDQRAELSSLIQAGLGHAVNEEVLSALAEMQSRLRSRIAELGEQLTVHEISPKSYIQEMDSALREASNFGTKILGEEDFHAVFGEMKSSNLFGVDEFFREERD